MGTVSTTLPSDGQTIDAADVNTPINAILSEFNGNIDNDNIKSGAAIVGSKLADASITAEKLGTPVAFSASKNGTQSITTSTITTVTTFTERFDYGSNFDSSTGIFTAPYDGVYQFNVQALIDALNNAITQYVYLYKEGTLEARSQLILAGSGWEGTCNINVTLHCSAGDEVDMRVFHDYGSSRSLKAGDFTNFSGFLVART